MGLFFSPPLFGNIKKDNTYLHKLVFMGNFPGKHWSSLMYPGEVVVCFDFFFIFLGTPQSSPTHPFTQIILSEIFSPATHLFLQMPSVPQSQPSDPLQSLLLGVSCLLHLHQILGLQSTQLPQLPKSVYHKPQGEKLTLKSSIAVKMISYNFIFVNP